MILASIIKRKVVVKVVTMERTEMQKSKMTANIKKKRFLKVNHLNSHTKDFLKVHNKKNIHLRVS